jgi:predicted AlkP superfamily pyrophosphatase or phosphodiesterase
MSTGSGRVLLVDVAGLSHRFLRDPAALPAVRSIAREGGTVAALRPSLPALTCSVQAALTTGSGADRHGIVANGLFDRDRLRASFWDQSDRLVQAERVWTSARRKRPGFRSAMLFWQNSIGSDNDVILTPAPIHRHHGGIIHSCYAKPSDLYDDIAREIGAFDLSTYWGPRARAASTRWIADATVHVLERFSPDLLLTYLPHLDYNQQRWGPSDPRLARDLADVDAAVATVVSVARSRAYDIVLVSDYGMTDVRRAAFPNRALREAGLLAVRTVRGMDYLDIAQSRAWAMSDHQVAHVHCRPDTVDAAREVLGRLDGVEQVLDRVSQKAAAIDHPRSGDLVLVSARDAWFAYPWWTDARQAPDFASHVDIHNKPGYDPLELFLDRGAFLKLRVAVASDTTLVRGSHGRVPGPLEDHGVFVSSFPLAETGAVVSDRDVCAILARRLGIAESGPALSSPPRGGLPGEGG